MTCFLRVFYFRKYESVHILTCRLGSLNFLHLYCKTCLAFIRKSIDVKNINLQIKNIKNMFLHLYKNILKNMHKNIKTAKKHKKYMFF